MKLILLAVCLFLGMNISSSHAAAPLEKPSWFSSINKPEPISKLDQLLADKNIKEFYQELSGLMNDISIPANRPISSQQLQEYLYVRYLAATAPLIHTDNYENIDWMMNKSNLDLKMKSRILRLMSPRLFDQEDFKSAYGIPKAEAIELFNGTQALILSQFKKLYNPDMKAWREEQTRYFDKNRHLFPNHDSILMHFNTINIKMRRNSVIKNEIEDREKYFAEYLVQFYPKTGSKVIKFLDKAGYGKKEMPELIDRTVGRSEKSDYLYRMLPKKKKQEP